VDTHKIAIPTKPNLTKPNLTNHIKHLEDENFKKVFNDYLEMRNKIRKPATERAKELVLNKLQEYSLETAVVMLENSIIHSWQDVYPLKEQIGNLTKQQKGNLQGLKKLMEEIDNDKQIIPAGLCGPDGSVPGPTIQ
jgi:hypothetical protein